MTSFILMRLHDMPALACTLWIAPLRHMRLRGRLRLRHLIEGLGSFRMLSDICSVRRKYARPRIISQHAAFFIGMGTARWEDCSWSCLRRAGRLKVDILWCSRTSSPTPSRTAGFSGGDGWLGVSGRKYG